MIKRLDLKEIHCFNCNMLFAMPSDFEETRFNDGRSFYCPAGHQQYFTKRENELNELRRQNQQLSNRVSWAEMEAENAKREKTALKGQLTKTRNRIANGVCPCCHRTFKQLATHMSNKHPDFKMAVQPTQERG